MKRMFLFGFPLLFLLMAFSLPKAIEKRVNKEIKSYFKTENFSKELVLISPENNAKVSTEFGKENLYKIMSDETHLAYAYIGKAPSKIDNFDFLVLFDPDFVIIKSKILIYREDYGGEIGSKRWLRQFIGKSPSSETLELHNNIISISGATISTRSMTQAVNSLLQSIATLKKDNIL